MLFLWELARFLSQKAESAARSARSWNSFHAQQDRNRTEYEAHDDSEEIHQRGSSQNDRM